MTIGPSFLLKPEIVLLAEGLKGKVHSGRLLDSDAWQGVYVIPEGTANDHYSAKINPWLSSYPTISTRISVLRQHHRPKANEEHNFAYTSQQDCIEVLYQTRSTFPDSTIL